MTDQTTTILTEVVTRAVERSARLGFDKPNDVATYVVAAIRAAEVHMSKRHRLKVTSPRVTKLGTPTTYYLQTLRNG